MEKNKFVVDLGKLELTDDQRGRINASIQKVVAGELATMNQKGRIVLVPIKEFPHGGILNGIVARIPDKAVFDQLLGQ